MTNVTLVGRIVRDFEFNSKTKDKLGRSSIAVDGAGDFKDGKSQSGFFSVEAWGANAEFAEKWLKKGSAVSISGELRHSTWTDGDGNKREKVVVKVSKFGFVPGGNSKSEAVEDTLNPGGDNEIIDPFGQRNLIKDILEFPVVGTQFSEGGVAFARLLKPGEVVELRPEPDNAHDPDAIQVLLNSVSIGYVPNKGFSCSNCWSHMSPAQDHCEKCEAGFDYMVQGGLATRLNRTNLFKKQYACYVDKIDLHSKTIAVYLKLITEQLAICFTLLFLKGRIIY